MLRIGNALRQDFRWCRDRTRKCIAQWRVPLDAYGEPREYICLPSIAEFSNADVKAEIKAGRLFSNIPVMREPDYILEESVDLTAKPEENGYVHPWNLAEQWFRAIANWNPYNYKVNRIIVPVSFLRMVDTMVRLVPKCVTGSGFASPPLKVLAPDLSTGFIDDEGMLCVTRFLRARPMPKFNPAEIFDEHVYGTVGRFDIGRLTHIHEGMEEVPNAKNLEDRA